MKEKKDIYLVLDNIRSLHNVGAIFRTAEAAKVKKIYLCGLTGYPPRKEIDKTALRTVAGVSWEYVKDVTEVLKKLKKQKVQIIALEQRTGSLYYNKAKYSFPSAVIVGHELYGVSERAISYADMVVELPMYGRIAESLNVATATGIALYKLRES